ncbi:LysR family transcriptional regulator [Cognatitamlana onchidii]|uniref:LysR family transcriptional regulator n=1 Tax=Cognatitamlana onchidii TaxID=2562860 RepID=UPI001F28C567|nr:LysR family transcriptional regulator [Algibacter onchidii]
MITIGNQLELRHIRYFLAVAEDLHFRKAAERLFISQPGLSRQIRHMEDVLGLTLFHRHNRKVELTVAGAYLKDELNAYNKSLEHTFNHAKRLSDGQEGALKLGYVGSAMNKIIPELLLQFEATHKDIVLSLQEMDNQRQIDSLISQDIDLGFVRLDRIPRGIRSKPLLKEPFCIVLPKEHSLDATNFNSISQLREEPFILFNAAYSASYFEKVMGIFDEAGFVPNVTHNTIHAASIYTLVDKGFGISIVPKSLVNTSNDSLKFIEIKSKIHLTTLSAVWNERNRNPVLQNMIMYI